MNTLLQPTRPLSQAQKDAFSREGWLLLEDLFTDRDLQPIIDEVQAAIDAGAADLMARGQLSRDYREFGFDRQLAKIGEETNLLERSIGGGSLAGPAVFNVIRHQRLLDIAESICGPELIASSVYRIRPKLPRYALGEVPWHQDSGYIEPFCDDATILTFWIPLVDATKDNGCMWILPRCHKNGVLRHRSHPSLPYLVIDDRELPTVEPICAAVKKGGALLLHNLTPHASFVNTSDSVRWSLDTRYQAASLPTNATITRLPGEMVSSAENGIPPACYPPEADFLIRSKQRPSEVVTDPAVFHRIRREHLAKPVTPRWR